MSDRLAALLAQYSIQVNTFHAGRLGSVHMLEHSEGLGQLHLITEGVAEIRSGSSPVIHATEPTVILFAKPASRVFHTEPMHPVSVVSADLDFQGGSANPILASLPDCVSLPLANVPDAAPIFSVLQLEVGANHCGRKVMMNSLCQVVLIHFLRELMDQKKIEGGTLAGLSHPLLTKAIVALHDRPDSEWTINTLAKTAGMSRTSFAEAFKNTVGVTPMVYLQTWRIGLAQSGIKAGRALKLVAMDVGYASEGALSRAFRSQTGHSPREWKKELISRQAA